MNRQLPRRRRNTVGISMPCLPEDKVPGKPYCVYEPKKEFKGQPTPRSLADRKKRIRKNQPSGFPKHYDSAAEAKKAIKMMKAYGSGWRPPTTGRPVVEEEEYIEGDEVAPTDVQYDIDIVNTEAVPGRRIVRCLGLVEGSIVKSKHIGRDIMAGLKTLVGGELRGYTELMQQARDEAVNRMLESAAELGANAIVNVRYTTSAIMQNASEILVYGTAVTIE